jgi:hypothetical protein
MPFINISFKELGMISSDLLALALDWLSKNSLGVVVVLYALVPVLAISVLGYAVHVLAKTISRKN